MSSLDDSDSDSLLVSLLLLLLLLLMLLLLSLAHPPSSISKFGKQELVSDPFVIEDDVDEVDVLLFSFIV